MRNSIDTYLSISDFSTVYEDQLQKHMKKCNSREKPKPVSVYFAQDINAGLKAATELPEKQVSISTLSKEELEDLIRKLRRASNSIKSVLKDQILSHQALEEALNDPRNGDAAFKHLKQQASLLGNMERLHLLGPDRCFVEFGAGRGKLSHWVDIALHDAKNVHFLLVERETTRFKVDGKHRKNGFERLQVDIQHLCLNKVPVLAQEKLPVVGIGKHVCGAATEQSSEAEELDQEHRSAECSLDGLQGLLTTEERKQIGRLCKLLIDHGRIEYLQQRGYKALLQRYTDFSVSLENVLLTAVPCQSSLSPATA
ncbi:hypothetical protein lerEdw1_020161 [Lerista edwardsae]|nr:hypothetical protein lerEdw1_020161 [Lerista edwardsae]